MNRGHPALGVRGSPHAPGISQTKVLEDAEPASLEPPRQPLTGDSHAHLLAPLRGFAESLVVDTAPPRITPIG